MTATPLCLVHTSRSLVRAWPATFAENEVQSVL